MYLAFCDDSSQKNPSRQGMGPLVSTGGLIVEASKVGNLETEIAELCRRTGFSDDQEFKWSPGRELWMRDSLCGEHREKFFLDALELTNEASCTAIVVVEDTCHKTATQNAESAEFDTVILLLERVDQFVSRHGADAVVIADLPGGARREEHEFLRVCLEIIIAGTSYAKLNSIPINVMTANSRHVRLLQMADLITACTTAFIGGEDTHSPKVFEAILPLLRKGGSGRGGSGLKIHPDFRYVNLYHWLLGDTDVVRLGRRLPIPDRPYAAGPTLP